MNRPFLILFISFLLAPFALLWGQTAVGTPAGTFSVTPTGAASYAVAIEVPKGIGGLEPKISICYNSQAGNGIAGWGCNISGISVITTGPRDVYHDGQARGIRYDLDDAYFLDGQRLIADGPRTEGSDSAVYHPEGDPYTRVVMHNINTESPSQEWFSVSASDGMQYEFGKYGYSRGNDYYYNYLLQRICTDKWYVCTAKSPTGETIDYYYQKDNGMLYPDYIRYNGYSLGSSYVRFEYEARPDTIVRNMAGSTVKMGKRLKTVRTSSMEDDTEHTYRSYAMSYGLTGDCLATQFSRLTSITESNGAGERLNPVSLYWVNASAYSPYRSDMDVTLKRSDHFTIFDHFDLFSADFNGDGVSDIVQHAHATEIGGGQQYYNNLYIFLSSVGSEGSVSYPSPAVQFNLYPSVDNNDWTQYYNMPLAGDVDGDGLQDLIVPYFTNNVTASFVYVFGKDITAYNSSTWDLKPYSLRHSSSMPLYAGADFDGDCHSDLAILESGGSGGSYDLHFMRGGTGGVASEHHTTLSISSDPKKLYAADFNSDAMPDLLVVTQYGYQIFWNTGCGSFSDGLFLSASSHQGYNVTDATVLQMGDFNGDGQPDLLSNAKDSGTWYFLLGRGNGNFDMAQACQLDVHEISDTDKDDSYFSCHVGDFDSDGRSDAIVSKAMFSKNHDWFSSYYRFSKTKTYWLFSNGSALTVQASATSDKLEDAYAGYYMTGDFNGDGTYELASYGYDCHNAVNANVTALMNTYYREGYMPCLRKVSVVTDGMSEMAYLSYKSLTDHSVYSKTAGSTFPLLTVTPVMDVVSSVMQENGAAGKDTTSYHYKDFQWVQQGRGSLGFRSLTVSNSTTGSVTENTVAELSQGSYFPLRTVGRQTVDGSTATTESRYKASYVNGTRMVYRTLLSTQETDLDGNQTTTVFTNDSLHGNVPLTTTVTGFDGAVRQTIYSNYLLRGGRYLPQLVRVRNVYPGSSPYSDYTKYEYDGKGRETRRVLHYGTPQALATASTYNFLGELAQTTTTGSDIETVTNTYQWDNSSRFITRSVERGYIVREYTYDLWGNVLTEIDKTRSACPDTARYEYNGWGQPVREVSPEGIVTTYERGWLGSQAEKYYVKKTTEGSPWVRTTYDAKGRQRQTTTAGINGIYVCQRLDYDVRGRLVSQTDRTGARAVVEQTAYDRRGRVTSRHGGAEDATFTYGQNTVTVSRAGRTYTSEYDSWGNITETTDPVSSIAYSYGSNGKPVRIASGTSVVDLSYDGAGNRTLLGDPDAGTSIYSYDALGRLTSQTDANDVYTVNTYNSRGQLAESTTGDETVTYTYGTGPTDNGLLLSVSNGSYTESYQYDSRGRMTQVTRDYRSEGTLTKTYTYNRLGQVCSRTFPGQLQVDYEYDAYGHLIRMLSGGDTLYAVSSYSGMQLVERMGQGLTRTSTVNTLGQPLTSSTKADGVPGVTLGQQTYTYDPVTHNLATRQLLGGAVEAFSYDDMDRLAGVTADGVQTGVYEYDDDGSITRKDNILFTYADEEHAHAVSRIDAATGTLPLTSYDMQWSYDGQGRMYMVEDFQNFRGVTYSFGPDGERWESGLDRYFGDYEERQGYGGYVYLDGGVLCRTSSYGAPQFYYMLTDHLGSILQVVDANGTEVFRASYDAWGRQTVSRNTIGMYRGYCGHEMLNSLGLIHMNGRVYDPILGRFLSPDNYVQQPDNSQNFNRYSYCLNNPLKYTDPTGDFLWVPIVMGAMIGTYTGGVIANDGQKNPLKWDFSSARTWRYMIGGGITGAISGSIGGMLTTTSMPFSNTLAIASASFLYSAGTYLYTGGQTPITVSFGVASYDFTNGNWGYLWKKGNTKIQNCGYFFGALANLSDIVSLTNGGGSEVSVNSASTKKGEEWWGHSSITDSGDRTLVSVGPMHAVVKEPGLINTWNNSKKIANIYWDSYVANEGTWHVKLYNVSVNAINRYMNRVWKWDLLLNSCVGHTTRALWLAGVPTLYLFHPHLLNLQLMIRQLGIYASPYFYNGHYN